MKQWGQPYEDHWPYAGLTTISSPIPPDDPQPRFYALGSYDTYSINTLELFVKSSQPVIVTMTTDQEFRRVGNNDGLAIVEHNPDSKKDVDVHAVLAAGYGVFHNRKYIKVRNSWGEDWGDDAYAWVSEDFFQRMPNQFIICNLILVPDLTV